MNIRIKILILTLLLSLPYVYYATKLQNYLETYHQDKIEKLGLPKKVKFGLYYYTPKRQLNALRFILSKENFNDLRLAYLKSKVLLTTIVCILAWLLFGSIVLFYPLQGKGAL